MIFCVRDKVLIQLAVFLQIPFEQLFILKTCLAKQKKNLTVAFSRPRANVINKTDVLHFGRLHPFSQTLG